MIFLFSILWKMFSSTNASLFKNLFVLVCPVHYQIFYNLLFNCQNVKVVLKWISVSLSSHKEENKGVVTMKILITCNVNLTVTYIQNCRHIYFLVRILFLEVFLWKLLIDISLIFLNEQWKKILVFLVF